MPIKRTGYCQPWGVSGSPPTSQGRYQERGGSRKCSGTDGDLIFECKSCSGTGAGAWACASCNAQGATMDLRSGGIAVGQGSFLMY